MQVKFSRVLSKPATNFMSEKFKTTLLKIASILTEGMQVRAEINSDYVADCASALKSGSKFPPVVVFQDDKKVYYLADGFHRVEACKENGAQNILAEIHPGNKTEALKFALGANATHGLRLTNKDKRHSAEIALREFPKLSDHELARICAVSHPFIGGVRKEIQPVSVASSPRVGGDGKARSLPPKKSNPIPPKPEVKKNELVTVTSCPPPAAPKSAPKSTSPPPRPVKPAKPEKPQRAIGPMDATGIEVPPECLELWKRMEDEAQNKMSRISALKGEFKKAEADGDIGYIELDFKTLIIGFEQAYVDAKRAKPFAVCTSCNGIIFKGCQTCKGRGFVSEFYWRTFIPEETRRLRTVKK